MRRTETQKTILVILCLVVLCTVATSAAACTSFSFDTEDGIYFGANLDLHIGEGLVFVNRRGVAKEGYRENTKGETSKWVAKYGSVTFNLVGREMAWGGMNEAGLVASTMTLEVTGFAADDERSPMGSATWIQYILDTCGTVAEVIASDSLVRLVVDPTHFLIADEQGNCAVIEYLGGEFVYYTGETLPVKALANATYESCLAYIEHGELPAFNPGASAERVAAASALSADYSRNLGVSATDYALGILTEAVVAPKHWWCDWFDEPYTRWSIAYDIARREIHFRTVASQSVKRLSFDSFDFSCDAPVLMLDVNTELKGSVDGAFATYDREWNLDVFRSFCDRWGIELSREQAEEFTAFQESFECASGP